MKRRHARTALDVLIRDAARALDGVRVVADETDDGALGATLPSCAALMRVAASIAGSAMKSSTGATAAQRAVSASTRLRSSETHLPSGERPGFPGIFRISSSRLMVK